MHQGLVAAVLGSAQLKCARLAAPLMSRSHLAGVRPEATEKDSLRAKRRAHHLAQVPLLSDAQLGRRRIAHMRVVGPEHHLDGASRGPHSLVVLEEAQARLHHVLIT